MSDRPVLALHDVTRHYRAKVTAFRSAAVKALDGVSLAVRVGETLGIVGESGCGKSTLGRVALGLEPPTSGRVELDGADLSTLRPAQLRRLRRRMQMVFQDPLGSLNPRMSVQATIGEPLRLAGELSPAEAGARVRELLDLVGLGEEHLGRFPHQLSGGQQQRVGVARALASDPDLLVLDEPTSALDVSVQAQLINLLAELQARRPRGQIFISHDLAVVGHLCDRVAVMYLGRVVEVGTTAEIYGAPRHPYTAALVSAAPGRDLLERRRRIRLRGEVPSPLAMPAGCAVASRCPFATDRCRDEAQALERDADGHAVACWRATRGEIDVDDLRERSADAGA